MHINLRTLDIACLAGLAALALGGGFTVTRSVKNRAVRLDRDRRAVEVLRAECEKAEGVLGRLDAALRVNQHALEALRKRLPEAETIGAFLADLDALAGRAGVKVSTVTPGRPVAEELCMRTPFAFSCEGSFEGIHALLSGLENMDRLVRVARVTITKPSPSDRCNMDVACNVYGR